MISKIRKQKTELKKAHNLNSIYDEKVSVSNWVFIFHLLFHIKMTKRFPVTLALKALREYDAKFQKHSYEYTKSGTKIAAQELDVDEHLVVKTLVMEDERGNPFIILMHGDKEVSTKEMARTIQAKSVTTCSPKDVKRYTGYLIGGISPFGTRRRLPIYIEKSILNLPRLFINAGKRGLIVEISPSELTRILKPSPIKVAR